MTLNTILDKLNIEKCKKEEHANSYCSSIFVHPNATRKKVSEYLKKCVKCNKSLTYEKIDAILNDEIGVICHFYNYVIPEESEYDYVEIEEDGRIYVWCETDGFIAYIDEYNMKWFSGDDYESLVPFIKKLGRNPSPSFFQPMRMKYLVNGGGVSEYKGRDSNKKGT